MGKIYRLATNDFIFGGGDGYAALARGKAIIDASAGTPMRGPHHPAELSARRVSAPPLYRPPRPA